MALLQREYTSMEAEPTSAESAPTPDASPEPTQGKVRSAPRERRRAGLLKQCGQFVAGSLARLIRPLRRRTITVSMEEGHIRVVTLVGRKVTSWGISVADSRGPDDDDVEVATGSWRSKELRALLRTMPGGGGRVVSNLPLYTALFRHLRLPKIGNRYLGKVVLSEVLETLPFLEHEADVVWRSGRVGTGHAVSVVVVPRQAMDAHVQMLKGARARPAAVHSAASSLALAAGVPDVIVIDLHPDSAGIVLVQSGVPRVVHRVEMQSSAAVSEETCVAVARGVEIVAGCYVRDTEDEEVSELPIVLTGPLSRDADIVRPLEAMLAREVLAIHPPFRCPEHFPTSEYAANLGLALADRQRGHLLRKVLGREPSPANLLPERHRSRVVPVLPLTVLTSLALFMYAGLVFGNNVDDTYAHRATLSSRVAVLEREARSLEITLAGEAVLLGRTQTALQLAQNIESRKTAIEGGMEERLAQLETITRSSLPAKVRLSTLLSEANGFILEGTAPTYGDVILYAENLQESGLFSTVTIAQIQTLANASVGGEDNAASGSVSFLIKPSIPLPPAPPTTAQTTLR